MRVLGVIIGLLVGLFGVMPIATAKGPCAPAFQGQAEYRAPTDEEIREFESRPLAALLKHGELEVSGGWSKGCFSRITTTERIEIGSVDVPKGSLIMVSSRVEVHTVDPASPVTWNSAPVRVAKFEVAGQYGALTSYLRLTAVQLTEPSKVGAQWWKKWVHFDHRGRLWHGELAKEWAQYPDRVWIGSISFQDGHVAYGQLARDTRVRGELAPAGTAVTHIRENGWVGTVIATPDKSRAWLSRGRESIEATWSSATTSGELKHTLGEQVRRHRGLIGISGSDSFSIAVMISGARKPLFYLRTDEFVEPPR